MKAFGKWLMAGLTAAGGCIVLAQTSPAPPNSPAPSPAAPAAATPPAAPAPGPAAAAAPAGPPSGAVKRSQAQLEQLVAPIALYPDPLLATLLPASAYPIEIVQAARFVKDTNNIAKVDSQPWDQNVKALAQFPDVIAKLNDELDWTTSLGQAFVDDQKGVMDAVQAMRTKAQQAGTLQNTPQQNVVVTNTVVQNVTNTVVQIVPAQPEVVYVPTYNPATVYAPPPPGQTLAASALSFGVGMAVGAAINNNCDWNSGGVYVGPRGGVAYGGGGYHNDVDVNVNRNVNVNQNANINRNANVNQTANVNRTANANNSQKWQADPSKRTSVPAASAQSRGYTGEGASSGKLPPTGRETSATRPEPSASRPEPSASRPEPSASRPQPSASRQEPSASRPAASSSGGQSAFNSSGSGAQTRQASARGSGSRGGGGGGGRR